MRRPATVLPGSPTATQSLSSSRFVSLIGWHSACSSCQAECLFCCCDVSQKPFRYLSNASRNHETSLLRYLAPVVATVERVL
jgi:hypothetical protein